MHVLIVRAKWGIPLVTKKNFAFHKINPNAIILDILDSLDRTQDLPFTRNFSGHQIVTKLSFAKSEDEFQFIGIPTLSKNIQL